MTEKPKIEGWRKISLGMGSITALSLTQDIDFKIAVIIGIIAIVGIICQSILDHEKKKVPQTD